MSLVIPLIVELILKDLIDRGCRIARILEASVDFELMAYELETGLHSIGEIIGRKDNEDMLDSLFNQFCIGK